MAKRFEKGIIDNLINVKLLGKRKLGLPLKYNYENTAMKKNGRLMDMLYFPKTQLDKFVGNVYERCMPGLKFFFWDEQVKWARHHGWTLGEKFFHSFRHAPNIQLHSLAQLVHPWGYLEGQRRDAFERKVDGLIPGMKVPDWAHETRRVKDFDVNSIRVPVESLNMVFAESTPAQHLSRSMYFAPQYFLLQKNAFGYPAQRLFYNEDLRGDFYKNGYKTKEDKDIIHGWYANSQDDSLRDRVECMSEKERVEFEKNKERWDNNFEEFYPELSNKTFNPCVHKYEEPHFERNMQEIRSGIFASKWIEKVDRFSGEEIHAIHEFFLNENTEAFFTQESKDDEVQPTELYKKFVKELDFPDFFEIDRFTTYPPEKQFYDLLDSNWGIDFDTVETYKNHYIQLIKNNPDTEASSLVLEEIYNPLFKSYLKEQLNEDLSQTQSYVLLALEKGKSINELNEAAKGFRENVHITSTQVLDHMVQNQVRKVVKTFL